MQVGEDYGKYRLIEKIASGGMAEVFRAVAQGEAGFEKTVAIKRLHAHYTEDEELVTMLQDEARLCSQLIHANICQVLDLGRVGDTYYIAMEYVSGKDLFSILKRAAQAGRLLPLPAALYVQCELLAGLDYAHRKTGPDGKPLGITHRDISPQNVLITYAGEVKVIDFGIAKARGSTHRTQAGVVKGKFRYMSPEQARGEPVDYRTDVFAAGVMLYEMVLGRPHAAGATDQEVLIKIQMGRFERLGSLVPNLSPELEQIVHRALAIKPDDRYSSARAFRKAILDFCQKHHLVFSRDDLAEYVRFLFPQDAGSSTAIESVENLSDQDLLASVSSDPGRRSPGGAPPGPPGVPDDPFAPPSLPPLDFAAPAAGQGKRPKRPVSESFEAPEPEPEPEKPAQPKRAAAPASEATRRTVPEQTAQLQTRPEQAVRPPGRSLLSRLGGLLSGLISLAILAGTGYGVYYVFTTYIADRPEKPTRSAQDRKVDPPSTSGPVRCTLKIRSAPPGARIVIAGQDSGRTTPANLDVEMPSPIPVELQHQSFPAWKRAIPVGPGDEVSFEADLRHPPGTKAAPVPGSSPGATRADGPRGPARSGGMTAEPGEEPRSDDVATLSVVSDVNGAEVLINGQVRGTTPFFKTVRPSTFTIQVRHQGRTSARRTVKLAPGGEQVVRLNLQP
jgi:serine/threonine-protein kinase